MCRMLDVVEVQPLSFQALLSKKLPQPPFLLQRQAMSEAEVTQLNSQRSHQDVAEQNLIEESAVVPQN